MKHLTLEQLEQLRSQTATRLMRIRVKKHLDRCPACLNKLHELEDADLLISELKQAVTVFAQTDVNENDQTYLSLGRTIGKTNVGTSTN